MSTTENPGNSVLAPIPAPDAEKARTALAAWDAMAQGAYSKNTRRGWKADGAVFQAFYGGGRGSRSSRPHRSLCGNL